MALRRFSTLIRKAKAWKELLKLGLNVRKLRDEIDLFFRGNILGVLRNEGWFEYLITPRTAMEIASYFNYTDIAFLEYLLDILVEDDVLDLDGGYYELEEKEFSFEWACPSCFDTAMSELWVDHARAIPDRLRGKYLTFSGGLNLFNWDDALSNKLYEQIRRAAFSFSNALEHPIKFLDVGSGNGRGTAAIWSYYFDLGHFYEGSSMQIFGIDPDDKLLTIANAEFPQMVSEYNGHLLGIEEEVRKYHPEFKWGFAENIPFDDETFDVAFLSQVLHWTSPKDAIRELLRVIKPGGYIFGTQNFHPDANKYNEAHFKVVDGANGFFYKNELEEWAKEEGATKIEFATPIAVFKIVK